jgi:transposase InsO family protein
MDQIELDSGQVLEGRDNRLSFSATVKTKPHSSSLEGSKLGYQEWLRLSGQQQMTQEWLRSSNQQIERITPISNARKIHDVGADTTGGLIDTSTPTIQKMTLSSDHRQEIIPLQSREGSELGLIRRMIAEGNTPRKELINQGSTEFKRLCELMPIMKIMDGILKVRTRINNRDIWTIICPKEMRPLVIRQYHTQHHSGINKTYQRIKLTWFWPGMVGYIRRAVNSCEICQSAKHSRDTQVQSQQRLFAGRPWQVVSLDLVGPLQKTPRGNSMILVISDHFTRWKDAIAIPDGTAITIVETLERQVFNYFGLPERIHTDRGAQFEGQLLKELCQLWKVDKSKTTPYHPQGNGVVERGNKDLGNALRAALLNRDDTDWDLVLPYLTRSIRGMPHSLTGETPNYLMFGRELTLPDTLVSGVEETSISREEYAVLIHNRMTEAYDTLREKQANIRLADHQQPPAFEVGDQVWLKNKRHKKNTTAKLQPKWIGPYKILEANSNHTYLIELHDRRALEHESRLKLYVSATQSWGQAPRIPETLKQPTRTGYPRENCGKGPKTEEETPYSPDKLQEMMEIIYRKPMENSESGVTVAPKEVKQESLEEPDVIVSEQEIASTGNNNIPNTETENLKRTRKLPEKFKDFVVYQISNQEPAQEDTLTPLDEEEWPCLSRHKKSVNPIERPIKRLPVKWGRSSYAIKTPPTYYVTGSINRACKGDNDQTLPKHNNNMRPSKYSSLSDSSSDSSESDSDQETIPVIQTRNQDSLLDMDQETTTGQETITEANQKISVDHQLLSRKHPQKCR